MRLAAGLCLELLGSFQRSPGLSLAEYGGEEGGKGRVEGKKAEGKAKDRTLGMRSRVQEKCYQG